MCDYVIKPTYCCIKTAVGRSILVIESYVIAKGAYQIAWTLSSSEGRMGKMATAWQVHAPTVSLLPIP